MNQRFNIETIYPATAKAVSTGDKVKLNFTPRPNGRFAVLVGLVVTLAFTATESDAGTMYMEDIWQVLSSLTVKASGINRFNAYSGIGLVRRLLQMDEILQTNQRASFLPVADVATLAGNQAITMKVLVHLAPGFYQGKKGLKALDGGILLSDFDSEGEISYQLGATAIGDDWSVSGNITVTIDAHIVQCARLPLLPVVEEVEDDTSQYAGRHTVQGDGNRRYTGLLVTDDGDGDLTLPTAFHIEIDGDMYSVSQTGSKWVDLANMHREDGVNDIAPACLPLITTARHNDSQAPVVNGKMVIEKVGAQHGSNVRVQSRCQWTPNEKWRKAQLERLENDPGELSIGAILDEAHRGKVPDSIAEAKAFAGRVPAASALRKFDRLETAGLGLITVRN